MRAYLSLVLLCCLHLRLVSLSPASVNSNTTTMIGKHLSTGSVDPPLEPGKIRVYSMRFCPYSQRVHLTLLAKEIPYDPVFINLQAKPEWYAKRVPTGKVPAILIDGESVYDSLIIVDLLDEKYSQRPLNNKDPLQKAKDRLLIDSFGKVISPFYKVMTGTDASVKQFEEVVTELKTFEKNLKERGTKFFGGDKPGIVDYAIWPWFERMEMFKVLYGAEYAFPEQTLPTLANWLTDMKADEAVKKYYVSPENHAKFMKTNQAGSPDYDILSTNSAL